MQFIMHVKVQATGCVLSGKCTSSRWFAAFSSLSVYLVLYIVGYPSSWDLLQFQFCLAQVSLSVKVSAY